MRASRRRYAFRFHEKEVQSDAVQDEHAQSAIQAGEYIQKTITLDNGTQQTVLALPIKLRGQVLGVLDMHFNSTNVPQDLVQLMDATTNRLALALENARLLEEIQVRAEREHLVGDISARVRASTAVDDILGAAASELGRSFGVSEVVIQLRPDEE